MKNSILSPYLYTPKPVRKWKDLYDLFCRDFPEGSEKETWLFRGHNDPTEPLRTSLEKALCNISGTDIKKDAGVNALLRNTFRGASICEIEKWPIRRFKRQYHHFDVRLPESDNYLEWLSIMRHYGTPIRMLD